MYHTTEQCTCLLAGLYLTPKFKKIIIEIINGINMSDIKGKILYQDAESKKITSTQGGGVCLKIKIIN